MTLNRHRYTSPDPQLSWMDPFTTGAFVVALLTVGVLPRFARSQNHRESQGVALLVWAFLHFLQPL